MPARVSRSSVSVLTPKTAKNKNKKRSLDAYAAASKQITEKRIPQNRLGELIDDGPRQKRRRGGEDDDTDAEPERPVRQKISKQSRGADDDNIEYGSDSSGHNWTTGGLAEDAEDSEIDSDEAFGESDEERFQGFTFRGSSSGKGTGKTSKARPSQSKSRANDRDGGDLDEDESSADDDGDSQDDVGEGFGDDAVDLAAMLDDDDEEMLGGKETAIDTEEGESDDEAEQSESSTYSEDDEDDDPVLNEERSARLKDTLEALDPVDRSSAPAKASSSERATIDDFLADTELAGLLAKPKSSKNAFKAKPTAAPLPKRQQDQLDRQVASEKAKEQLDRWRDTVIKNRRSEFLSFPLQDPSKQNSTHGKVKFTPLDQQAPRSELEESIRRIMQESGLASGPQNDQNAQQDEEAALLRSEELAVKEMPVEEVMRRRAALRQSRELLFREEMKAKRIAKIKSKSYRRVHRKERERLAEQEREAMEGLDGGQMNEDEKERADRKRAEARMSTKHKDSKWAKSLKATNRTTWDDEARDGVIEQARRNEELKKRIAGRRVSDESGDGMSDSDGDESYDEAKTLQELAKISKDNKTAEKGLAGMKFMRTAEDRKRKANEEDVERLRKELAVADGDEDDDDIHDQGLGRAIFGPRSNDDGPGTRQAVPDNTARLEFEAPDMDEDLDNDEDVNGKTEPSKSIAAPKSIKASGPLAKNSIPSGQERDEQASSKASSWLNAPKGKSKTSSAGLIQKLDSNAAPPAPKAKQVSEAAASVDAGPTNGWTTVKQTGAAADSDSDSEPEQENPMLSAEEQRRALQQRAFAGDDVVAAFEAEKAAQIESEDEKEVSTHMPGWGSWAGNGLTKSVKKANARAKHNPLYKTKLPGGVKAADRKDAKLGSNVIISEKQDRKGKKYLAPSLPHEFETKEQYERSRRLPMGPEWTTKEVHQRMTRPRVVAKKGVRLEALERPLV